MSKYGLEKKPTYQELIKSIEEPKYTINIPNRVALGIVNSPYLNFIGNETFLELEDQNSRVMMNNKIQQKATEIANEANKTKGIEENELEKKQKEQSKQMTRGFLNNLYTSLSSPEEYNTDLLFQQSTRRRPSTSSYNSFDIYDE